MRLSTRTDGEYLIVTVFHRLDAATAPDFEASCAQWIDGGHANLILDMTGLEYISSAGLRGILVAAKKVQRNGGGLALCGLSGGVQEVIQLSGFDRIIPTYPTAEKAMGAV
jgi:anti-sigma B factor antagonist